MDDALFDSPPAPQIGLSQHFSAWEYRLNPGERARWTVRRSKRFTPCQECSFLQHETRGRFGPKRTVIQRRTTPNGTKIEMCGAHCSLWKDRDFVDGRER